MPNRLLGKVAVITGGARGIGYATARAFCDEGADVLVVDRDEPETVISGLTFIRHDISQPTAWEHIAKQVHERWGRLDILFNNAGISGFSGESPPPQDPKQITLETWRDIHQVNMESVLLGCKMALERMSEGGSIINMASRSGLVGIPTAVAYAASKASIISYTKSVALYCAAEQCGIRCNSVSPAAIDTPMWDILADESDALTLAKAQISEGIPVGRMGTPEEVAMAVVYLASDESSYVTGTNLTIDGGILAGAAASYRAR